MKNNHICKQIVLEVVFVLVLLIVCILINWCYIVVMHHLRPDSVVCDFLSGLKGDVEVAGAHVHGRAEAANTLQGWLQQVLPPRVAGDDNGAIYRVC